jgi:uncharacterized protein YfaS (alpha-2-macroglobulin family)
MILTMILLLSAALPCLAAEEGAAKRKETAALRLEVSSEGKPVRGIGVFVMNEEARWSEQDTTDSRGLVNFREVPRGKVLVQIIEKEWKDFGQYYSLGKAEESIRVALERRDGAKKKDSPE